MTTFCTCETCQEIKMGKLYRETLDIIFRPTNPNGDEMNEIPETAPPKIGGYQPKATGESGTPPKDPSGYRTRTPTSDGGYIEHIIEGAKPEDYCRACGEPSDHHVCKKCGYPSLNIPKKAKTGCDCERCQEMINQEKTQASQERSEIIGQCNEAPPTAPKNNLQEGKPRPSLLPLDVMLEFEVSAYEEGCIKYERDSWRRGFNTTTLIDAALRHITAFMSGEDWDPDAQKLGIKKHHLAGAIWCLRSILWTLKTRPELDDR